MAGYTPPFSGHGRMKVGVDQSAVSVLCCNKVGTLLCRFLTRVYPVVSFTLKKISAVRSRRVVIGTTHEMFNFFTRISYF